MIRNSRILLVATFIFLLPTIGFSQSHQADISYRQFLNTRQSLLSVNGNDSIFFSPTLQWNLKWHRQEFFGGNKQERNEWVVSYLLNIPLTDSLHVFSDLTSTSVFSEQSSQQITNHELISIHGINYKENEIHLSVGVGPGYLEQMTVGETGYAIALKAGGNLPIQDILAAEAKAEWLDFTAGNRFVGKQQFRISLFDEKKKHGLTWIRNGNKRDQVIAALPNGSGLLNYRHELSDRMMVQIENEIFDDLFISYYGELSNRIATRFSDLSGSGNPNFSVTAGLIEHNLSTKFQIHPMTIGFNILQSSGKEQYKITDTPGLTDLAFDIQDTRLKKRNYHQEKFQLSPFVIYQWNLWTFRTSTMASIDQLFNPNNQQLDDRDIGTIGSSIWLGYNDDQQVNAFWQLDYQHSHFVFIHKDQSADNYRNHFLKFTQFIQWKPQTFFTNKLQASISSQFRVYDYDDRFFIKKSFSFRSLQLVDSISYQLNDHSGIFSILQVHENFQGRFIPSTFSEIPDRSVSIYRIEGGYSFYSHQAIIGGRFINQDQFLYQAGKFNLLQNIQQVGPYIRWKSELNNPLQVAADGWFSWQLQNEKPSEFYPTINIQVNYLF